MYYSKIKETAKRPELLATIAPFINPATLVPAAAIGTIFLTAVIVIKKLKSENRKLSEQNDDLNRDFKALTYEAEYEDESDFEPHNQPLKLTAEPTIPQPLNEPLIAVEHINNEALKKEMIRQAMSELGKRSAKARAKKKEG